MTEDYLQEEFEDDSDDDWEDCAPISMQQLTRQGEKTTQEEQVIVLSEILDGSLITEGCEYTFLILLFPDFDTMILDEDDNSFENAVLAKFNGEKPISLIHFAHQLDRDMKRQDLEFFEFTFLRGHMLVLPRREIAKATKDVLDVHDIAYDRRVNTSS